MKKINLKSIVTKKEETIDVFFRMETKLIKKIDKKRGDLSRQKYIIEILDRVLP